MAVQTERLGRNSLGQRPRLQMPPAPLPYSVQPEGLGRGNGFNRREPACRQALRTVATATKLRKRLGRETGNGGAGPGEPDNRSKPAACRGMERREPFTGGQAREAATGPSCRNAWPCAPRKFDGPKNLLRPAGARREKRDERLSPHSFSTGCASGRSAAAPLHPRLHSAAPLGLK